MKKCLSKAILLILTLLFLGGQLGGSVRGAEDSGAESSGPRFAVRIMIPANQREGAEASFNLLMAPGSEQVIEMEVESLSTEPIVLLIDIASATTTDNGELVFRTREGVARDSSLTYALEDVARVEDTRIPLDPGEMKTIPITIRMPDSSFDGILAGGITIQEELDMSALLEEATGNQVNVYLLETMIFLQQTEVQVTPDIQVIRAMAEEREDENVFAVTLQNTEKSFVNEMSLHARVTRTDSHEVLHEIELTGLQMAPNSNFTFAIPMREEVVEAGDFALHVKVDSYNGSWEISSYPLTITPELAERMNEEEEYEDTPGIQGIRERIEEIPPEVLIFAGSGLLLLILIVLLIVGLVRRKTRSKQENQVNELMDEMMKQFRGD